MSAHVGIMLAIHKALIDHRCIQILVESVPHNICWDGCHPEHVGFVLDVSCPRDLLFDCVIS